MSNKNDSVFARFNIKAALAERKAVRQQKRSIEWAKQFGENMVEGKKKFKEDFMKKLLENAQEMNRAREDFDNPLEAMQEAARQVKAAENNRNNREFKEEID